MTDLPPLPHEDAKPDHATDRTARIVTGRHLAGLRQTPANARLGLNTRKPPKPPYSLPRPAKRPPVAAGCLPRGSASSPSGPLCQRMWTGRNHSRARLSGDAKRAPTI